VSTELAKILPHSQLLPLRERLHAEGKILVLTNGCFDLLHLGHVRYLQQARALGDVLVVGLNNDASARALKGEGRPLVPQEERAEVLAALASVDYVVIFEEHTAERLVAVLKPDIYVKGGDWQLPASDGQQTTSKVPPEAKVVAEYGGQVVILPYLPDHSTTAIIQRIRESG
jgi:rfaE bifunctional protein nucleotidyltransferase chain/domain